MLQKKTHLPLLHYILLQAGLIILLIFAVIATVSSIETYYFFRNSVELNFVSIGSLSTILAAIFAGFLLIFLFIAISVFLLMLKNKGNFQFLPYVILTVSCIFILPLFYMLINLPTNEMFGLVMIIISLILMLTGSIMYLIYKNKMLKNSKQQLS